MRVQGSTGDRAPAKKIDRHPSMRAQRRRALLVACAEPTHHETCIRSPCRMTGNDDAGDALHLGVSTMCSQRTPPSAAAIEKQRSTNDHSARFIAIDCSTEGPSAGIAHERVVRMHSSTASPGVSPVPLEHRRLQHRHESTQRSIKAASRIASRPSKLRQQGKMAFCSLTLLQAIQIHPGAPR